MADTAQTPQIPVKVDQRKIMTPDKLERLRLARETRARNRLVREEKRMELAKQMILASAGVPESSKKYKSDTEMEKKLKWESRKNEIFEEFTRKISEANAAGRAKLKEKEQEPSDESDFVDTEAPPAKRRKLEKKQPKRSPKTEKRKTIESSSHTAGRERKKRTPVKPVVSDSSQLEESEESESEVENVLKLW